MNFMKKGLLFFMISFSLIFLLFNFLSADNKNLIINPSIFENLEWRNIGPAIMGGRLTDIEGVPGNPNIIYVATASSGLWKTMDGGITWKPIFDEQDIQSIGDIAIAPLNPDLIWVGTGEDNPRNSVSFGNGVYKSTDGGKTWIHMGLEDTERISRIIIHPTNPDIVYVAAVGHVFGPNKNRGVFMTIDGGKTWKKVLYIDEYHGASDLEMNPKNPNILYAGMWYFQRKPWDFDSGSDKGGVYKSIDGGLTWKKITKGLPQKMGRIGIKVAPSNPEIVYVITEAKEGTLYRSENGGDSFKLIYKNFNIVSRGFYYTELRVDPQNEDRVYAISSRLWLSIDGGKTFKSIAQGIHVDFHTMWIDPFNPSRIWVGNDGGIAVSYNKGKTWEFINNISLGQFYQIYVDNREPFYYVCGGLQDNGTWCGPSRTREPFGILNDSWYMISFGDGFYVVSHPENPDLYLSESQGGNISLNDMRTGESRDISPYPKRNDGGPVEELKYRFNWNAPIIASPHDPKTIYFASNVVFKSTDFGHTWEVISPDLTTNDPEKQKSAGGPIYPENTTAEYHCTIISLAESPVQKGVIWVGTDDGNVQLTRDGGKTWINLIKNVKGIKPFSPVSHIEPSRTSLSTAYIAFDRHMFDDFKPYIFMTTDFGKTWKNISFNLPPKAYVHVVREDPQNPNLLYAGTEIGLYVSWNKGKSWMPLRMKNLPPAAVHDILIHARENDLILGTHGRSIWIFDDATPIQKLNSDILNQDLYLFDIRPALMFAQRRTRVFLGNKTFIGPNPPYGALIYYYLKEKPEKKIKAILQIFNEKGEKIKEIKFKPEKGLNRVVWDLTYEGYKRRREVEEERPFFIRAPRGPRVLPGIYEVKLKIGEKELSKKVKVRIDPTISWNKEELKKQLEVSLELRDMISGVNLSLKTLDNIEKQLKSLKENLKEQLGEVPKDVNEKIENNLKNIEELKKKLNREGRIRIGTGNKLLEHLRSLHRDIQTPFKAPTPYQLEFFRELKEEFKQKISEVEKLFKEEIPILNNFLKKHNLPIVIIGKSK